MQHSATIAPSKPKRVRARTLTTVSKATRLGKRIAELKSIYADTVGPGAASSPLMALRVAEAAETKALAEFARGNFLRGTSSDRLDDIIRAERRAVAAEKALGSVS